MRDAINLMYDLQMAFYKDIMDKVTGHEHSVIFIAQEKTPPYCVNILEANEYFYEVVGICIELISMLIKSA